MSFLNGEFGDSLEVFIFEERNKVIVALNGIDVSRFPVRLCQEGSLFISDKDSNHFVRGWENGGGIRKIEGFDFLDCGKESAGRGVMSDRADIDRIEGSGESGKGWGIKRKGVSA